MADELVELQATLPDAARLIRHLGVSRCVLSSDGGSAGSPPPAEILAWSCTRLAEHGFTAAELTTLVRTNPARLLATAP